jgi:hypothetical protein
MTSTISVVRCGHSRDRLFTHGSTRSKNRNAVCLVAVLPRQID